MKTMELTVHKNKLKLRFPYEENMIAIVKNIPGVRWSSSDKSWYFPLTELVYKEIQNVLKISCKEVDELLVKKKIDLQNYTFKVKPYDHQLEAMQFILSKFGFEVEGLK